MDVDVIDCFAALDTADAAYKLILSVFHHIVDTLVALRSTQSNRIKISCCFERMICRRDPATGKKLFMKTSVHSVKSLTT